MSSSSTSAVGLRRAHRHDVRDACEAVGDRMREWRISRRVTQRQLAERVGITQSALSNYENGKREMPLFVALNVSRALQVPLGLLVPVPGMQVVEAGE